MTERDALLAAIRERPQDDAPRLVFADWLEEQGNPLDIDQAEFIRLQIAIDQHPELVDCSKPSANWCPVCGDCKCPHPEDAKDDPGCPLHSRSSNHAQFDGWVKREREMIGRDNFNNVSDGSWFNAERWFGFPGLKLDIYTRRDGRPALVYRKPSAFNETLGSFHGAIDAPHLCVYRGFPGRVSITWGLWQRTCNLLIAAHPIEKVSLMTWPTLYSPIEAADQLGFADRNDYRICLDYDDEPLSGFSTMPSPQFLPTSATYHRGYVGTLRKLFGTVWQHLKFEFPTVQLPDSDSARANHLAAAQDRH